MFTWGWFTVFNGKLVKVNGCEVMAECITDYISVQEREVTLFSDHFKSALYVQRYRKASLYKSTNCSKIVADLPTKRSQVLLSELTSQLSIWSLVALYITVWVVIGITILPLYRNDIIYFLDFTDSQTNEGRENWHQLYVRAFKLVSLSSPFP